MVRVATHCSEADVAAQHIAFARELGMDTVGFLMMSHMISPQALAQQALKMESYGATYIYVVDSGGAMNMNDIRDRFRALKAVLKPETATGMHAHHNLSLGAANSIVAVEEGAVALTPAWPGWGRGGQCAAGGVYCRRRQAGWQHGTDLYALMNAADELVRPLRIARCVSTAKRWRWATPESTPASCATAKRRPSAMASARWIFSSSWASGGWSAARRI